jgi:hypothetical protein
MPATWLVALGRVTPSQRLWRGLACGPQQRALHVDLKDSEERMELDPHLLASFQR